MTSEPAVTAMTDTGPAKKAGTFRPPPAVVTYLYNRQLKPEIKSPDLRSAE